MAQDPFNLVKEDIQESLDKAQAKLLRLQSLSRSSPDTQRLQGEVDDECKSIAWQVEEMEKAVDVAEQNMQRFGLTQAEVAKRRKWILQTRREVEQMEASLVSGRKGAAYDGPPTPTGRLGAAVHEENERFIGSEGDRQQLIMRQQDAELDTLGEHVARIGHVGLQIHEEMNQQSTMLDELDEDLTGTSNRLAAAQKRMNHVLAKAGMRGQLCVILFLIVLLVILTVLAFS